MRSVRGAVTDAVSESRPAVRLVSIAPFLPLLIHPPIHSPLVSTLSPRTRPRELSVAHPPSRTAELSECEERSVSLCAWPARPSDPPGPGTAAASATHHPRTNQRHCPGCNSNNDETRPPESECEIVPRGHWITTDTQRPQRSPRSKSQRIAQHRRTMSAWSTRDMNLMSK